MKKQTKKKTLLEYLDNRDGMIVGFTFIFISFIFLIIFYLLQSPIEKVISGTNIIWYMPKHIYIWLFVFAVIFAIIGFVICEIYLLKTIHSLRIVNKWSWQTKSKLQKILINIPSSLFLALVIIFFGSLFLTGTTMSEHGYNKFTRIYLFIIYPLTSVVFLLSLASFTPWVYTPLFQKLTLKYK